MHTNSEKIGIYYNDEITHEEFVSSQPGQFSAHIFVKDFGLFLISNAFDALKLRIVCYEKKNMSSFFAWN